MFMERKCNLTTVILKSVLLTCHVMLQVWKRKSSVWRFCVLHRILRHPFPLGWFVSYLWMKTRTHVSTLQSNSTIVVGSRRPGKRFHNNRINLISRSGLVFPSTDQVDWLGSQSFLYEGQKRNYIERVFIYNLYLYNNITKTSLGCWKLQNFDCEFIVLVRYKNEMMQTSKPLFATLCCAMW